MFFSCNNYEQKFEIEFNKKSRVISSTEYYFYIFDFQNCKQVMFTFTC